MSPLATPYISRDLSRSVPFASPNEFQGVLGPAATVSFSWDVLIAVADRNLIVTPPPAYAAGSRHAVGPYLDAFVFGTQIIQMVVEYGLGVGTGYRIFSTTNVAAATPTNISALRVTARFVRITFTNMAAVGNTIEVGGYLRSN